MSKSLFTLGDIMDLDDDEQEYSYVEIDADVLIDAIVTALIDMGVMPVKKSCRIQFQMPPPGDKGTIFVAWKSGDTAEVTGEEDTNVN